MQAIVGNRRFRGFTLVELSIVISVIGILLAVSVVGYGNWREQTEAKAVQSDLKQVAAAMESARNFSNGYPTSIPSSFSGSSTVELSYISGTDKTYCIQAHSKAITTIEYYVNSSVSRDPQPGHCT